MYTITEKIHHGDYRQTRIMQVTSICSRNVKALLDSSPYAYTNASPETVERIGVELLEQLVTPAAKPKPVQHGWSDFTVEKTA